MNVASFRIDGEFELETLVERLKISKPNHSMLEGGWASINDEGSNINVVNAAPPDSDPEILSSSEISDDAVDELYPQTLVARYYFFKERPGLREVRPEASDQELHEVDAIDIAISRAKTSGWLLLVSTRNLSLVRKHPLRSLELILGSLDPNFQIRKDDSPVALPSHDLYLWLMVRARDSARIDNELSIRSIEAVHGQDSAYRVTVLSDSVDFDRPGFLIAVVEGDQLGPAKVTFVDEARNVRITTNLYETGDFAILTGDTYYPEEPVAAKWRLKAVFDMVYRIIPRIVAAYNLDEYWRTEIRSKEIREAAELLVRRYS